MGLLAAAPTTTTPRVDIPNLIGPTIHGFLHGLVVFWPITLLAALGVAIALAVKGYELRRLARSGISEIDAMDGRTFEEFLATLFRRLGHRVTVTRYRGDFGADLVIERDGEKTAVQAKRWHRSVGIKAVQEAAAAKAMYGCAKAMVVTNRRFTPQALALARVNGVVLWDRDILVSKLLEHPQPPPQQSRGTPSSDACVVCGGQVSVKVRDYCVAHPERFGGRIYCYTHQRTVRRPEPGFGGAG